MSKHPKIGFSAAHNEILLWIGRYTQAFSHIDMALTFGIVDRLEGDPEAALIVLNRMGFSDKKDRLLSLERARRPNREAAVNIEDFARRLADEGKFRNQLAHSTIGIGDDGEAYLNSYGKGFGQASTVAHKVKADEMEKYWDRCWTLFLDLSESFSPERYAAFCKTLR